MHISHIWKARRSETEERIRLGLTHETDPCPSSASGSLICNEPIQPFKGEMNSENISGNECDPSNVSKRHKVEMNFPIGYEKEGGSSKKNEVDVSLPVEAVRKFLMTWKGACREKSVAEVLEWMILLYVKNKTRTVKNVFSSYPGIGLLNVAVSWSLQLASCIRFAHHIYYPLHTYRTNTFSIGANVCHSCFYLL
ncbi:hypothetical protein LguiB_026356 [Lonicera macranthoides]